MSIVSTINLDRFLNGSSKDKKALAAETDHICSEIGFLSVVGHGIHDSLIQNIYDRSKCFFRGPMDAKLSVSQTKPDIYPVKHCQQRKIPIDVYELITKIVQSLSPCV